jgi:hypothetical protein
MKPEMKFEVTYRPAEVTHILFFSLRLLFDALSATPTNIARREESPDLE